MGKVVIQPYISVSKLKKIKTKFLRCTGYLNSIKNPVKQELLLILVLVRQQNFLNCQPCVLQLLKNVIKYCEKVYERLGKHLFWSIKMSGEVLKLEISMRPICLLIIFLLFTLLNLII